MLEESLEVLPPGDSALRARLLARLAAALQPSPTAAEPVRRRARGDRDRAASR